MLRCEEPSSTSSTRTRSRRHHDRFLDVCGLHRSEKTDVLQRRIISKVTSKLFPQRTVHGCPTTRTVNAERWQQRRREEHHITK